MDQVPQNPGDNLEYKPLLGFPGVYYCFDHKDPAHDLSDVRPQETLYLFIDKVDEAIVGITYDENVVELYCPGLIKTSDVDRIMTKILGGMRFKWIN